MMMNYRMKNIGATASLYKVSSSLGKEFLEGLNSNTHIWACNSLDELELLFDHEAESGCDYFNNKMCQYFSDTNEPCLKCSVKICPLGPLVEDELKAIANNLDNPFTEPGEEVFEGEE
jgi:hypothetical protein